MSTINIEDIEGGLLQALLSASLKENKELHEVVERLQMNEIKMRDEIAMVIFPTTLPLAPNAEAAVEDAYKAADAFIRIKERGKVYKEDILEKLTQLAESTHDNAELGVKVRLFLKSNTVVNET